MFLHMLTLHACPFHCLVSCEWLESISGRSLSYTIMSTYTGDTVTQHAALACVWFCLVIGHSFLTCMRLYLKHTLFFSVFPPLAVITVICVFVLDQSLFSIQRSCCVSSSFWKCTWRVPVLAAGSPLQHVQGCCPSWWTLCTLGPLRMY